MNTRIEAGLRLPRTCGGIVYRHTGGALKEIAEAVRQLTDDAPVRDVGLCRFLPAICARRTARLKRIAERTWKMLRDVDEPAAES